MIGKIYKSALSVIAKKPLRLWGTSILGTILSFLIVGLCGAVPILAICIGAILSVGLNMVYLHGYRGEQIEPYQLFDGFKSGKVAGRTIKGMLYRSLILFLWSLPALIPLFVFAPFYLLARSVAGVVILSLLICLCLIAVAILVLFRYYQYCLTPYILVEEEEGNPFEAYKESAKRTKGYCGQLLLANLIPGIALSLVSIIFSLIIWGFTSLSQVLGIIFLILFGLVYLVVMIVYPLFMGLVHAAFYEELTAIYNNGGAEGYQQPAYGAGYPDPYGGYQQPAYQDPNAGYQQPAYQDPNAAYQQPQYQDPNAYQQQPPYQPPYQGQ